MNQRPENAQLSPETEALRESLQQRIDEVSNLYAQSTYTFFRKNLPIGELSKYPDGYSDLMPEEQISFWRLVSNNLADGYLEIPGEVATTVIKGNEIVENKEPQDKVYLASVSKIAIMSLFEELSKSSNEERIVVDAGALIGELIKRKQGEVLLKDPELLEIIKKIFKFINPTIEFPIAEESQLRFLDILSTSNYNSNDEVLTGDVAKLVEEHDISIKTILMLGLKYSANTPVAIARNYAMKKLGSFETYAETLASRTPGYSPTKSTQMANHWIQPDANTGHLSEFLKTQHELAKSADKKELTEYLSNNEVFQEPFFDFSGSETGKALIAKGYTIIEKTGYYDGVRWVEDLARRGMPAHLPFATCVTVLDNEGKVVGSFSHYKALGIVLPTSNVTESEEVNNEKFDLTYPDYDNAKFKRYMQNIHDQYSPRFRSELEVIWQRSFVAH